MPDDVMEIVGEGAVEPGADDAVHALPVRRVQGTVVLKNVVLKRVLAQGEQELLAPPSEAAGGDVEDDVDKMADVLDGHCLGVEVKNSSSLLKSKGGLNRGTRAIGEGGCDLLGVLWRVRKIHRGPFLGRALQGGADARGCSVALSCRRRGLSFGLFRAGEGGATGGAGVLLALALDLVSSRGVD